MVACTLRQRRRDSIASFQVDGLYVSSTMSHRGERAAHLAELGIQLHLELLHAFPARIRLGLEVGQRGVQLVRRLGCQLQDVLDGQMQEGGL